jgi:PIN domain nuclease of toxin-antitoxin system
MQTYILDACAIIATSLREKGHELVAELYDKSMNNKVQLVMHRITLLEV